MWVGEDGLVRKLEMTMSMTEPGTAQAAAASMSYEMFDYGEPVHITLPLPAETVDVSHRCASRIGPPARRRLGNNGRVHDAARTHPARSSPRTT